MPPGAGSAWWCRSRWLARRRRCCASLPARWSSAPSRGGSSRVAELDAAGVDVDAALEPSAGELRRALDDGGPHVQLDLLGHPQAVVHQIREPIAAACPRLDPEPEPVPVVARVPLDLAR